MNPWDNEPDQLEWIDEHTGLPCLITRRIRGGRKGSLRGYVGVPKDHPAWRLQSDEVEIFDKIELHNAISFTGQQKDRYDFWWMGFSCDGPDDHDPMYDDPRYADTYRGIDFVKKQTGELARQIRQLGPEFEVWGVLKS